MVNGTLNISTFEVDSIFVEDFEECVYNDCCELNGMNRKRNYRCHCLHYQLHVDVCEISLFL